MDNQTNTHIMQLCHKGKYCVLRSAQKYVTGENQCYSGLHHKQVSPTDDQDLPAL